MKASYHFLANNKGHRTKCRCLSHYKLNSFKLKLSKYN